MGLATGKQRSDNDRTTRNQLLLLLLLLLWPLMLLLLLLLLLLLDVRGIPCVSWGRTRKVSAIFEMRFPFPR